MRVFIYGAQHPTTWGAAGSTLGPVLSWSVDAAMRGRLGWHGLVFEAICALLGVSHQPPHL